MYWKPYFCDCHQEQWVSISGVMYEPQDKEEV